MWRNQNAMKFLEVTLWSVGAILIILFVGVMGWQKFERQQQITAFTELQREFASTAPGVQSSQVASQTLPPPEQPADATALEPENVHVPELPRVESNMAEGTPVGILRIPKIGMVVPVNAGTGTKELLRGAGLLTGSALPGSSGNVAIAAHRDSFFRGLKDVAVSDVIELDTLGQKRLYRITSLKVVEPTDVEVLADVGEPVLTLITCYPFYFVGHAPQRFIVRAVETDFR